MSGIEILGVAASVLQIADLGGQLSIKLFTFSRKIKNADKNIDSISKDIAATGAVLQQLGKELQKDTELRLCSSEAVATAKSLVSDCNNVFIELDQALSNKKSIGNGTSHKLVTGWKNRIKYPFLEAHVEMLRSTLERLKSSLLVMLNVLIFAEQLRKYVSQL
jgi:Fungal N-terminal domain of STAND proteins